MSRSVREYCRALTTGAPSICDEYLNDLIKNRRGPNDNDIAWCPGHQRTAGPEAQRAQHMVSGLSPAGSVWGHRVPGRDNDRSARRGVIGWFGDVLGPAVGTRGGTIWDQILQSIKDWHGEELTTPSPPYPPKYTPHPHVNFANSAKKWNLFKLLKTVLKFT